MRNCFVTIATREELLEHGHRAEEQPAPQTLYSGPAYLARPSRSTQQRAGWETPSAGSLHVHTAIDLSSASSVVITAHQQVGQYDVLEAGASNHEWRLVLSKRVEDYPNG